MEKIENEELLSLYNLLTDFITYLEDSKIGEDDD